MSDKFKILFDYGSYEGNKFDDGEFDTVDEAIKQAVSMSYGTPFRIVKIYWDYSTKD